MLPQLLGFDVPRVRSAYLLPFPDPRGGWMDHVRLKVFPSITTDKGTIKYLQPRRSGVRIYFPLATLEAVLRTADPLYFIEGEKKSLSVAQLGLPTVGICGIEGWHLAGARDLHPDLDDVGLRGRIVNVIPDSDVVRIPPCIGVCSGLRPRSRVVALKASWSSCLKASRGSMTTWRRQHERRARH